MDWEVGIKRLEVAEGAAHGAGAPCVLCLGQRAILEPSILGLIPVVCDGCDGTGRRPVH